MFPTGVNQVDTAWICKLPSLIMCACVCVCAQNKLLTAHIQAEGETNKLKMKNWSSILPNPCRPIIKYSVMQHCKRPDQSSNVHIQTQSHVVPTGVHLLYICNEFLFSCIFVLASRKHLMFCFSFILAYFTLEILNSKAQQETAWMRRNRKPSVKAQWPSAVLGGNFLTFRRLHPVY